MHYLLLPDLAARTAFVEALKLRQVSSVFHYVPLHSTPAGRVLGRAHGEVLHTDAQSNRLVRLPLWVGLDELIDTVIAASFEVLA